MQLISNQEIIMDFRFPFVVSSLLIFVLTLSKLMTRSKRKLPPGPIKLPLIGNLHLFTSFWPPHRSLSDLAGKYGPLMHLKLGELDTIVVSSPDTAKEILMTHDVTFASRPRMLVTEILLYNNTDLAFAPYGDYWRQLKKVCTLELLSMKRVQSFRSLRVEEFTKLCRSIASHQSSPINLTEMVEWTTCDMFTRAALGEKTNEQATFVEIFKESAELGAGFYVADMYPSVKFLRKFSGTRVRCQKLHEISDKLLGKIIDDHRELAADPDRREDFIDVLLKFNEPGKNDVHLTLDNIKALLVVLFSAGIETSSTTTDWAMAEMLRNPKILTKAQEEVRQVFGDRGFVDPSAFNQVKYLKLVIKETLRMHPPVPLLLPRESRGHCKIHGYDIPAKSRLMVNVWAIGRDPNHWKEPNNFNPERYLDNSVDYKGKDFEFLPFGAGRRICPGMSFGLANVELPLAMLLYHFDWGLPMGMKPENVDMTECFGISARRINPLHVIPTLKNPLPNAI